MTRVFSFFLVLILAGACTLSPKQPDCTRTPQGESVGLCRGVFAFERVEGPTLQYAPPPEQALRRIEDLTSLKIMAQNFELLIYPKVETRSDGSKNTVEKIEEKTEEDKASLARRIRKVNPDVIIGTEIQDAQIATEFSQKYLSDKYVPLVIEGNDFKGKINIVFLLKKDLPFEIEMLSFKNVAVAETGNAVYSRDLPLLMVRRVGQDRSSQPIMALIGTHYKSQRASNPPNPQDPLGINQRIVQVKQTVKIIESLLIKYPNLPIIFGGDFNGDVRTAAEFKPLSELGLRDALDVVPNRIPLEKRGTQYFFKRDNPEDPQSPRHLIMSQLDQVLVNAAAARAVTNATIQRDIEADGRETPIPQTPEEVKRRGSDHDAIVTTINVTRFLQH